MKAAVLIVVQHTLTASTRRVSGKMSFRKKSVHRALHQSIVMGSWVEEKSLVDTSAQANLTKQFDVVQGDTDDL